MIFKSERLSSLQKLINNPSFLLKRLLVRPTSCLPHIAAFLLSSPAKLEKMLDSWVNGGDLNRIRGKEAKTHFYSVQQHSRASRDKMRLARE